MKTPIKFEYGKQFTNGNGSIITMNALITRLGKQFVQSLEDGTEYPVEDLVEVKG